MGVERLESRVNLASSSVLPETPPPLGAGPAPVMLAAVAPPCPGQVAALTTSSAAVVAAFTAKHRAWTSSVDVVVPSLPDAGSSLRAQNVVFQAANDANESVAVANNGGVFLCGGTRTATKDNVSSQNLRQQSISWSFVAESITANYLGRTDPRGGDGDGNTRDDIDAVSVVGAVFLEWRVRTVTVNHSGDDGFDLTNASIAMKSVRVFAPVEDGLNLSTSLLQLSGRLEIDMTNSTVRDREIFDFEVDTGPVQIWIAPGATVDIRGYWGNSPGDLRIDVKSSDMPRPSLLAREWYAFKGRLVSKPARIF